MCREEGARVKKKEEELEQLIQEGIQTEKKAADKYWRKIVDRSEAERKKLQEDLESVQSELRRMKGQWEEERMMRKEGEKELGLKKNE